MAEIRDTAPVSETNLKKIETDCFCGGKLVYNSFSKSVIFFFVTVSVSVYFFARKKNTYAHRHSIYYKNVI